MDAEEIADRIALLFNPMPDMSGRQINRLYGMQRRRVEDLAAEIVADSAQLREAAEHVYVPWAGGEPIEREMRELGLALGLAVDPA